jgi:hypothetical protein
VLLSRWGGHEDIPILHGYTLSSADFVHLRGWYFERQTAVTKADAVALYGNQLSAHLALSYLYFVAYL